MWWGLSMDVGSKLPFSSAYFPFDHHSFRTLSGPMSHEYFQHLLDKLSGSISRAGGHLHTSSKKAAMGITMVDHKSMWAMAMNFPGWFSFASVILFHDNTLANTSYSRFIPWSAKSYLFHDVEVPGSVAAARYIAWILNPISESYQDLLVDYLVKVSELWVLKRYSSNKSNDVKRGHVKETRRLKLHEDSITSHELDMTVWHWLQEFIDMYMKVGFSTPDFEGFNTNQSLLLRRIPLGILIGYLDHLNAGGCALILHYAATGTVEKLSEKEIFGLNQRRQKFDLKMDSFKWTEEYSRAEAVAGCKIVFDITNVSETLSSSMFETEEEGLTFMCQVKLKTGDYLLKCIKRLLQLEFDGDCDQMRIDLLTRVIQWRNKGQDVFQNNKDFDNVCDSLNVQ
ncbi:hypothetical protein ACJIZ3_024299 [Penstemon smallii]|uniref:Uncharacterized protein n=1 Tax=Penstemon smallii TaxID=265156 RepID=A0ABD3TTH0_9LAMI